MLHVPCRYQDHVKALITRVNTINGYTYSEDPTIFAWELINEPRCQYCANGTIAVRFLCHAALQAQRCCHAISACTS